MRKAYDAMQPTGIPSNVLLGFMGSGVSTP